MVQYHYRAHFSYTPDDDLYIPCHELGISFQVTITIINVTVIIIIINIIILITQQKLINC